MTTIFPWICIWKEPKLCEQIFQIFLQIRFNNKQLQFSNQNYTFFSLLCDLIALAFHNLTPSTPFNPLHTSESKINERFQNNLDATNENIHPQIRVNNKFPSGTPQSIIPTCEPGMKNTGRSKAKGSQCAFLGPARVTHLASTRRIEFTTLREFAHAAPSVASCMRRGSS